MAAMEMNFQTALGGFHRTQVLDYIRKLTQQQQAELQELQEQLQGERATAAELQEKLEALSQGPSVQELQQALSQSQEETQSLQQENQELKEQVRVMQQQISAWAPNVSSYDILRLQLGQIELEARTRSAQLLEEGRRQEQALYLQGEAVLRRTEEHFRLALGNTEATLAHLQDELVRLGQELSRLSQPLEGELAQLSALHFTREETHE